MRYFVSMSNDYLPYTVVVRDITTRPISGRVVCIIPRDDEEEGKVIAQAICDALNKEQ